MRKTLIAPLLIGCVCRSADGAASFRGIGSIPGSGGQDCHALSGNGEVAVGSVAVPFPPGLNHYEAFRWSAQSGIFTLGVAPGARHSGASGVSFDGSVLVGFSQFDVPAGDSEPVRWTGTGGPEALGPLPPHADHGHAVAVTDDGTTIVGYFNFPTVFGGLTPFIWTTASGFVPLSAAPSGFIPTSCGAISADGSVITGGGLSAPDNRDGVFYWSATTGMIVLPNLPEAGINIGIGALSADGRVVVGVGYGGDQQAFRWTPENGTVGLGELPGGDFYSAATAVSGDGSVIVGVSDDGGPTWPAPFIWDAAHGMRSLRVVLETDYGLDLGGWTLWRCEDISRDGRTILGMGTNPCGITESWIARLDGPPIPPPSPCPGDVAHDGVVDFLDLNLLLTNFGTAARCGDLNGDGAVSFADLNLVLSDFGAHCTP